MEERLRFIARLLEGEAMTDVCREFGISRKTGYKILARYKDEGSTALTDRSRRPVRYANQLPPQIEDLIVSLKRGKPHWGARKIRELLVRRLPGDLRVPAQSTIHAVLDRHGLVSRMGKPRRHVQGTPLSAGNNPNDLWCADFKGEFRLGNTHYCYPLTVTDHASRYLLLCEALDSVREEGAIAAFARLFAERGLPDAIRTDNGVPFASPNALIVAADSEATSGTRITIGISGMIGITTELEAINLQSGVTLTISGTTPDAGLNGEGDQRGLFVYAGAVNVDDLVISGAVATGGRGDDGGGGGAGLGGGLFVADAIAYGAAEAGSVTLDGVTFAGDSAVGGKTGGNGGGGGGGLGGNGEFAGGGGVGTTATGGVDGGSSPGYGIVYGASGPVGGGVNGGGGQANPGLGGGIGASGAAGGFGGGGGTQANGETRGDGGFGGGGGAGFYGYGAGGFGAADGSLSHGGGGLGAGGDIFVMSGAVVTVADGTLGAGVVAGGTDITGGQAGSAFGDAIFLQGNETITLGAPGSTVTVSGAIADQSGSIPGTTSSGVGQIIVGSSATVTLAGADTYTGNTGIDSGGKLVLANTQAAGTGNITFLAGHTTLELDAAIANGATFGNALEFFANTDVLDLPSLTYVTGATTATVGGGTLTVTAGGEVEHFNLGLISPPAVTVLQDGTGGTEVAAACYLAGTLILTDAGERPIETLAIGDRVITYAGVAEPVRWIGRRSYAGRFLLANPKAHPVRFAAGSLGGGLPRRDLWVSPEHAMYLDGVLVPAWALVDGETITRDDRHARVDYVHAEFARHEVIFAEGAASESFVDDGSRRLFQNAHEFAALYPVASPPAPFYAPRLAHGAGVETIRRQIARACPDAA